MGIIHTLTPVEALYILDKEGIEQMDIENSLTANIGYLANKWFIVLDETSKSSTGLNLSDVGRGVISSSIDRSIRLAMRPYEIKSLEAISKGNAWDLVYAAKEFDFKKQLVSSGFLEIEPVPLVPGIPFFSFLNTKGYFTTEKYGAAVKDLVGLKKRLINVEPDIRNKYSNPLIYAFPSIGFTNVYSRLAKTLSNNVFSGPKEFEYPSSGITILDNYY